MADDSSRNDKLDFRARLGRFTVPPFVHDPKMRKEKWNDSGTSLSLPHVSGATTAFLSIRREFIQRPDDVKKIFLETATPLGRDRYFEGHGLIDLMRAIQSV